MKLDNLEVLLEKALPEKRLLIWTDSKVLETPSVPRNRKVAGG